MRPRIPLVIAAVTAVTVALLPGQASAAPAATPSTADGFVAPLHLSQQHLDATDQAKLDAITAHLPADWRQRLANFQAKVGIEPSDAQKAVAGAIDPSQYECQDTAFSAYVNSLIDQVDIGTLFILVILGVLDYPTYDAIIFGKPSEADDYGLPTGYKSPINQAVKGSQKFWDVDLFDVKTLAMQNDMLTDQARVSRIIGVLFGVDQAEADETAALVQEVLAESPQLDNGRNPIFTLNAFAFSAEGETDPIFAGIPDKMVWGEGLGNALDAMGLGTDAAKGVIGHEMGHHVQFEQGFFDSPLTGPEATRRTELMADSFGTYFIAHKRGLGMKGAALHKAEQAFYEVGDCSFDSDGHHGTPNQRLKASIWGADQAAKAQPPFPVQSSISLFNKFEKKLPNLVKPDAKPAA